MEIARFYDDIWPNRGINHTRNTVRAILVNTIGLYGFVHIYGEDEFGKRDHLETIGGGIEKNESLEEALKREVMEETGLEIISYFKLGTITDTYNLLQRETISTFFYVLVDSSNVSNTNLTESEKTLFNGLVWLDEKETLEALKNVKCNAGKLVQRRDLAAFNHHLKQKYL